MKTYAELLRDPRWQKKRLQILSRDNFACTHCESTENTLHVHHAYYNKPMMPWEYADTSLRTLCEDCHEKETRFLKIMRNGLNIEMGKHGATSLDYCNLATAIMQIEPGRLEDFINLVLNMSKDSDFLREFYSALDVPENAGDENANVSS